METKILFKYCKNTAFIIPLLFCKNVGAYSQKQESDLNRSSSEQKKLNVIFIVSDDLNNDMGCYDDPLVKTPNLDKLRQHAVRFNHSYCQFPLSGPSRASFLTGYSPDKTKVKDLENDFRTVLPNAVTLPELFKKNGYVTARIGKMFHAGVPGDIGQAGMDDAQSWTTTYNPIGIDKTDEYKVTVYTKRAPGGRIGGSLAWMSVDGPDDLHTDAIGANIACDLIRRNKNKPFFIGMGFYRPHTPFVAPAKYFDMYPMDGIQLPKDPADDWVNKPNCAKFTSPLNWDVSEENLRKCKRAYYASITFMDAQIGKLLDELERQGLADKTVIVFCGDNGYNLGQHGQWMKQSLFEHSSRVPLIISIPGLTTGKSESNGVVELLDIYPTVANVCTLNNIPTDLDGKNLLPLLKSPSMPWTEDAYSEVGRAPGALMSHIKEKIRGLSIRTERYRYSEWNQGEQGGELYDYATDPNEYNNLYNNPKYSKLQKELSKKLKEHYSNK